MKKKQCGKSKPETQKQEEKYVIACGGIRPIILPEILPETEEEEEKECTEPS